MIQLQNIDLHRGSRVLLHQTSLRINPKEKVGLVGLNGCGKSSLFQLFLGQLHTDAGTCQWPNNWRVSHMRQEIDNVDRTAIDFVIDGDTELRAAEQALNSLQITSQEVSDQPTNQSAEGKTKANKRISQLHARIEELDGYTAEARAARLLSGLGFSNDDIKQPVNHFSGGWRVRLALAQALMQPSDLLLLDEPTNHLDLSATLWLERWLKMYAGTLVIVSHDRDFLDQIVNVIVHVEHQQLHRYTGNYSQFETMRAERLALQQAQYEKQQQRIADIENFVRRFRYKASKAKQAQSRLKELQRMESIAPAHVDSPFQFSIPNPDKIPHALIQFDSVNVGYETKSVVTDVDFAILASSRIGLLGLNGAGKSTLLKTIAGELSLLKGDCHRADKLTIGYFAQHQLQSLDLNASPALHIQRLNETLNKTPPREQEIRQFLGGFDFHGDRVFESIAHFSGGEKARLSLALITWTQPHILILDEPTNHLDLEMRHALTMALQAYEGAVIVVSHDRHLLRNTVDELWLVNNGRLKSYDNDLDDYQQWLSQLSNNSNVNGNHLSSTNNNSQPKTASSSLSNNKKNQRQLAAQQRAKLKPLTDKAKRLEKEIEKLQFEKNNLEKQLADNQVYNDDQKDQLKSLLHQQSNVLAALNQHEEDWFLIQEELEELSQTNK